MQELFTLFLAIFFAGITAYLLVRVYRLQRLITRERDEISSAEAAILHADVERENANLRHKFEYTSLMIDHLPYPAWRRDSTLQLNYCNLAHSRILEDRPEQSISSDAMELFDTAREIAQKARQDNQPQTVRRPIVIGGQRKLFSVTEIPTRQGGTVGYALDISALEEAESTLKQHLAVQHDLMENSTTAIAIYGADMKLKFYNHAFQLLWKLDGLFLQSQPTYAEILEALREKKLLPEQANFSAFKKNNINLFRSLREKHEEQYYLPDERVLRVVIIPHQHGGLLFSYEDMTDHITLERSYNTLVSVKAQTLDNLFEGVAVFGLDGKLQLSNPAYAQMWQLNRSELNSTQLHITDIFNRTRHFYTYTGEWEAFRQSTIARITQRQRSQGVLERTDGSVLEWASIPLPDGATLLTYVDITDSRKVEQSLRAEKEALQAADLLKNNFLSSVSYEFRSPLTSIRGFSEMLLSGMVGQVTDKQQSYLSDILSSCDDLSTLIDDILDAASIDAGYMKMQRNPFEVKTLMENILTSRTEQAKRREVSLTIVNDSSVEWFNGDQQRLGHALINLTRYFISLAQRGSTVSLGYSWNENGALSIRIWDSKGVILPDNWNNGLEMIIAQKFIELHHGAVELIQQPELSSGSTVSCTLPVW